MPTPIYIVDAFASRPFTGNPAAVCPLHGPAGEAWMQAVAAEMNLSETAFLHPEDDGWRLRWFTPLAEVRLCGHATLASAHVLWETDRLRRGETARFHTLSGLLTATFNDGMIELDFPATRVEPAPAPDGLLAALGATARFVGRSAFDYLLEVDSAEVVRSLQPDFSRLRAVNARGIIVTSGSDQSAHDFISRFFAPAVGVNEDPVTGSAHCALGPYWSERLKKTELVGWQASARGGEVRVTVADDRVRLGGRAITMLNGELV